MSRARRKQQQRSPQQLLAKSASLPKLMNPPNPVEHNWPEPPRCPGCGGELAPELRLPPELHGDGFLSGPCAFCGQQITAPPGCTVTIGTDPGPPLESFDLCFQCCELDEDAIRVRFAEVKSAGGQGNGWLAPVQPVSVLGGGDS